MNKSIFIVYSAILIVLMHFCLQDLKFPTGGFNDFQIFIIKSLLQSILILSLCFVYVYFGLWQVTGRSPVIGLTLKIVYAAFITLGGVAALTKTHPKVLLACLTLLSFDVFSILSQNITSFILKSKADTNYLSGSDGKIRSDDLIGLDIFAVLTMVLLITLTYSNMAK